MVAAAAIDRFEATTAILGPRSWVALDAMVRAAQKRDAVDVASRLLDAADLDHPDHERACETLWRDPATFD